MKVFGVVGQNGSGKDEVLKYLKDRYNVPYLSTGDMVRKIAAEQGIEPTRENLGRISEKYFAEFGKGCFVRMAAEQIQQNSWEIAGITGIRSPHDISILREAFGKKFILFNVYVSDPRERYNRMTKRGEERDPQSYEQFLQQDEIEEEMFQINEAMRQADYALRNDGTLDSLHREIDQLITEDKLLEG